MAANNVIFNHLSEIGCCSICCARYVNTKFFDASDPNNYMPTDGASNLPDCDVEMKAKRTKVNPCIVCLGLLQNFTVDAILEHADLKEVHKYDSKVFTCSISMPASILIREHALTVYLRGKFPEVFDAEKEEVPLNKAWKAFIKNSLAEHLHKTFENSNVCSFSINITLDYKNDAQELDVLCKIRPKLFEDRKSQHRKYNNELFSRKIVTAVLEEVSNDNFKKYLSLPPSIPDTGLCCKNIECKHAPIYLAGRYCKYSRELSQSPWIIDGVRAMESSVQEIIFAGILKNYGIKENNLIFSSSGREDCDVRCLGKGRPFYIEILDPMKTNYTFMELRQLENEINKSKAIKIRDLQIVSRNELSKIKEGEDSKTKDYVALCVTQFPINEEIIKKINSHQTLELEQKTPVRVLHRRPLAVRKKMIHHIKAKLIPSNPNLFELFVRTQAGTYVKEFVHGDFGRTTPNLGNILNMEVDIAALDVVAINLDWPEPVDYSKCTDLENTN